MLHIEITYARIRALCVFIVGFQIANAVGQFVYHHFVATWIKHPLIFEKQGKWAIITGATNGLGRAFAEEFAERGMNIVLIDKNELELTYLANDIEQKYIVKTLTIPSSFSSSPQTYSEIRKQIFNLDIGVLVNNVHELQLRPGHLVDLGEEVDVEQELDRIISGNMVAMTSMCRIAMPGMATRGRGVVIVVAALTATFPTPMMATTAAAKAFEVKLAKDLAAELHGRGVRIRILLPGFLYCRWLHLRAPSLLAPCPATYLRFALPLLAVHESTTGYWPHDLFRALVYFLDYIYPPLAQDLTLQCMGLLREVSTRGYL